MNRRRGDTVVGLLVATVLIVGGALSWQAYQRQQTFDQMGSMMGSGGMMGYGGTTSGWWPFVEMLVPLIFLLIILGGGYLVFQRANESQTSRNPAMEELRTAYARGDLTDEEFEWRKNRSCRRFTTIHDPAGPQN